MRRRMLLLLLVVATCQLTLDSVISTFATPREKKTKQSPRREKVFVFPPVKQTAHHRNRTSGQGDFDERLMGTIKGGWSPEKAKDRKGEEQLRGEAEERRGKGDFLHRGLL